MSNNRNKPERLAGMFKALSNPNRLKIFLKLASCCSPTPKGNVMYSVDEACACVGELGRDLGVVPSTVSHHIKELHRAGLISMKRDGQTIRCSVEPKTVEELSSFFSKINGS